MVSDKTGYSWWWLRSPGDYKQCAAYVYSDGNVIEEGLIVNYCDRAVRPALWVNLEF